MANPLRDFFLGTVRPKNDLVEAMTPRRSFNDVILPASTRRALDQALVQIQKSDLMFYTWGLAERHATGLGLAFNFAGPPGTGKTICAEAIAHALGKKLLVVRYSEMESLWAGETGKNVSAVFRAAAEQDAVLFFDEADAIAGRRFSAVTQGYQREANTVVNVLLKELEEFGGVVIFATNLAANFDPAFERRIRTHVLFDMPDAETRAKIWQVQLHPRKTPLADDVDFEALAEEFDVAGGDIKNAVLKAAQMALLDPGPDADKRLHQHHFEQGMRDVIAAKSVMEQSLFSGADFGDGSHALSVMSGMSGAWTQLAQSHEELTNEVGDLAVRLDEIEGQARALPGVVERFVDAARAAQTQFRSEIETRLATVTAEATAEAARQAEHIRQELGRQSGLINTLLPRLEKMDEVLLQLQTGRAGLAAEIEAERSRLNEITRRVATGQTIMMAIIALIAGVLIYAIVRK